ncbi:hypothetical protein AVEN_4853-1 [Araneus ventricosus]|uniref:Uncharacterized protein n=1 Tax=Araneus ventricosus TaxID=182803 RepID=A0A4Y2KG76_ARAVE|nr:hypothetical protein AVEN_4853-1 [Araneus ventricosus]
MVQSTTIQYPLIRNGGRNRHTLCRYSFNGDHHLISHTTVFLSLPFTSSVVGPEQSCGGLWHNILYVFEPIESGESLKDSTRVLPFEKTNQYALISRQSIG